MMPKECKDSEFKEKQRHRNKLSYLIISFNQGLSSISELAVQYFFKDHLLLEPAKVSRVISFILIPWMIKPIFGLLTDLVPLFGYRRKVYIILCGILNMICWSLMAFHTDTLVETAGLLFCINLGLSFSTVLGEAVVVELSQLESGHNPDKAKDLVSLFFFCKYTGALISAYLKGLLVDIIPIRYIFMIASVLPFLMIISGIILLEKKVSSNDNSNNDEEREGYQTFEDNPRLLADGTSSNRSTSAAAANSNPDLVKEFMNFLCQKHVYVPTLFIIIFMSTPSYGDPYFYFLTNELKFTGASLGKISFCSTFTTLLAIYIYKTFLKNTDFKTMIISGTIASFIFSFLAYSLVMRYNVALGIPDFWLVLLSNSFLSMLGELILMPMLSLACMICPKNLEGTVYALFMSALNFGGILSNLYGSFITQGLAITATDYHNLHILILISNILTLVPLPFLLFIDDSYFHPERRKEEEVLELPQQVEVNVVETEKTNKML